MPALFDPDGNATQGQLWRTQPTAGNCGKLGLNGERPAAIRSAFTKLITPASFGRYSRANVVLPAPFGPAITMQRGVFIRMI